MVKFTITYITRAMFGKYRFVTSTREVYGAYAAKRELDFLRGGIAPNRRWRPIKIWISCG